MFGLAVIFGARIMVNAQREKMRGRAMGVGSIIRYAFKMEA